MTKADEVQSMFYPNQQLRSVSLQCYFGGRFSVYEKLPELQQALLDRFPSLYVPNAQPGAALALQPYELRGATESLRVAINQVAYTAYEYPGCDAFLAEALPLLSSAGQRFGIDRLERVVYAYDNEIGISREPSGTYPLTAVLDPAALPRWGVADQYQSFDVNLTGTWEHGQKATRVVLERREPIGILRMQIFIIVAPGGTLAELPEVARTAHGEAVRTFELMISDEFRRDLKGEEET